MTDKIPVEVGIVHEGERIRGPDMFLELGGPKVKYKAELVQVRKADEIEDGKVIVTGKDIPEFSEGDRSSFGILVDIYGGKVEKELEGVIERRVHDFLNYIQGFMHLNQRYDIWCRVSKDAKEKGLTFEHVGKAILNLFKTAFPFIEKSQITFITDEAKVKEHHDMAVKIYEERDKRVRGMKDEDVDVFYACTLCQSFAPNHVCVISPQRVSLCGSISWIDARAAANVDPDGPNFAVDKGELLDEKNGEYSGVNEAIKKATNGANDRFFMYSMFGHPHTSCCTPETEIINGGEVMEIGSLVDSKLGDDHISGDVLSLKEGKATLQEYFLVQKIDSPLELVRILTKTGLKIDLTPDHKVPVDKKDEFRWVEAKDLGEGDRVIALRKLNLPTKVNYVVDYLDDGIRIPSEDMGILKDKLTEKYGSLRKACKQLNIKIWQFYSSMPLASIKKIVNDLNLSWDEIKIDLNRFSTGFPVEISNPEITPDLMYLTGLIASDGSIVRRGKREHIITFVNTEKGLSERYTQLYKKTFPGRVLSVSKKHSSGMIDGRKIKSTKECYSYSSNNSLFGHLLVALGIKAGKAGEWNLQRIVDFPEDVIASFLRGYFDGDGSARLRSHKEWKDEWMTGEIYLAMEDEKAARHLQLLLKRLGIVSRVREDRSIYRVEVSGSENLLKFSQLIGSEHPKKAETLKRMEEYYLSAKGSKNTAYDTLPSHAGAEIAETEKDLPETTRYYYKTGRSRPHLSNVENRNLSPELKTFMENCFLDEVKSIERIESNSKYVYNLTVADTHCYFANQLLVKNCGCFEAIAFFIPEVEGIGIVDRNYNDAAVNGLKFSAMATQTGGGEQTEGFLGFGVEWMHSVKFFNAEGGWSRIVWLPSHIKERVKEAVPKDVYDKIATEKEVTNLDELKKFLQEKGHPVVERWGAKGDDLKDKVMSYIQEKDGEIYPDEASKDLGITEDELMKIIEKLQEDGVLG